tara:strand:- start:1088 stop:2932 length:1845 start_codon:yes stop_codon:yes gene_type:complete
MRIDDKGTARTEEEFKKIYGESWQRFWTNANPLLQRIFNDRFKQRLKHLVDDCFRFAKAGGFFRKLSEQPDPENAPYFWFSISNGSEFAGEPKSGFTGLNDVIIKHTTFKEVDHYGKLWNLHRMLQYIRFPFMERSLKHQVQFEFPEGFDPVTDPVYRLETNYLSPIELLHYFDWGTKMNLPEARYDFTNPKEMQSTIRYFEDDEIGGLYHFNLNINRMLRWTPRANMDLFSIYGKFGINPTEGLVILLFVSVSESDVVGKNYVELSRWSESARVDQRIVVDVQPGDVILMRPEANIRFLYDRDQSDWNQTCILRVNVHTLKSSKDESSPMFELGLRWRLLDEPAPTSTQNADALINGAVKGNPLLAENDPKYLELRRMFSILKPTNQVIQLSREEWEHLNILSVNASDYIYVPFLKSMGGGDPPSQYYGYFVPDMDSAKACYDMYNLRKKFGAESDATTRVDSKGTCPTREGIQILRNHQELEETRIKEAEALKEQMKRFNELQTEMEIQRQQRARGDYTASQQATFYAQQEQAAIAQRLQADARENELKSAINRTLARSTEEAATVAEAKAHAAHAAQVQVYAAHVAEQAETARRLAEAHQATLSAAPMDTS